METTGTRRLSKRQLLNEAEELGLLVQGQCITILDRDVNGNVAFGAVFYEHGYEPALKILWGDATQFRWFLSDVRRLCQEGIPPSKIGLFELEIEA